MKNKKNIIIGFLIIVTIGVGIIILFPRESSLNQKIVIIDNFKVFEEFQMKKDYDEKIESDFMSEKKALDSLGMLINQTKVENEANVLKKQFVLRKNLFDKQFNELSQKYTKEVYERLNIYLKSFGKLRKVDIIIGSNNSGNVMYVKEGVDLTDDLIKYINKEYSN